MASHCQTDRGERFGKATCATLFSPDVHTSLDSNSLTDKSDGKLRQTIFDSLLLIPDSDIRRAVSTRAHATGLLDEPRWRRIGRRFSNGVLSSQKPIKARITPQLTTSEVGAVGDSPFNCLFLPGSPSLTFLWSRNQLQFRQSIWQRPTKQPIQNPSPLSAAMDLPQHYLIEYHPPSAQTRHPALLNATNGNSTYYSATSRHIDRTIK
ncbi:hypothetical protein N657DRAFT_98637 [Parathielavia appendiculata]|uniref:Uncharacterized protein n=1 Tax=Parathielavia appendiculata TaxID=2587402 RepID=A0AAN6Z1S4_9PEZI|nr:hypothetical protein N657DRAFT_98637 [Parathielavia appendiculata]